MSYSQGSEITVIRNPKVITCAADYAKVLCDWYYIHAMNHSKQ